MSQDEDGHRVPERDLLRRRARKTAKLSASLQNLSRAGLVRSEREANETVWYLTSNGAEEAFQVARRHRLWEAFLMQEASLGEIVADRDAEAVEHFLPPDTVAQLEAWLKQQGREVQPLGT
jgi:manganese/zinc/iron transport system permease protein